MNKPTPKSKTAASIAMTTRLPGHAEDTPDRQGVRNAQSVVAGGARMTSETAVPEALRAGPPDAPTMGPSADAGRDFRPSPRFGIGARVVHMSKGTATDAALRISIGHHVSAAAADYAREKISAALDYAPEPLLGMRVRITGHADPAVARPIVAQANVNMNGRPVRVQVAAATTREAIDLLAARLRTRLERLARHGGAVHGELSRSRSVECRHGGTVGGLLPRARDTAEPRRIVRRKSYALLGETCDEAVFDMEIMDYDFHLFTESGTDADSVLYRGEDRSYRLAQVDPRPASVTRSAVSFTVSPTPAPALDVEDAVARLELTGLPFVFFRDRASNRGSVLYHRYDGDYGLITPPTQQ
ncbi:ribosome hibernation promotion factor [Nocardia xishanensis]|uniref:ribosome hibernation promotion factor n=1 Tax=Nocardia xishanensis TaxID=238964 RepID=UPI001FE18F70|nr:sigma 54 modulation/S30EA ribosomal C-terminal domain-containing protein [Nocardia xishanensis]